MALKPPVQRGVPSWLNAPKTATAPGMAKVGPGVAVPEGAVAWPNAEMAHAKRRIVVSVFMRVSFSYSEEAASLAKHRDADPLRERRLSGGLARRRTAFHRLHHGARNITGRHELFDADHRQD